MPPRLSLRRAAGTAALLLLAACSDRTVTLPDGLAPSPTTQAYARCTVDVAARTLSCTAFSPRSSSAAPGLRSDRIVGRQEVNVKLASSGTSWDAGTQILSSNVTVQNLTQFSMGTTDGTTVGGVKVFFSQEPTTTSGTGTVSLANADGLGTFTATNQPYFLYDQIVTPYEISAARQWQFNVPSTVSTFVFTVYVSSPMTDETGTLLDHVWQGLTSSDWFTASNWTEGTVPDSSSTVGVPADSLLQPGHNQPALTANADVLHLRVGYGSTLNLGGFTAHVRGNADAPGAITNGTLWSSGTNALLGGSFSAVQVSGSARLQRSTVTSGPVSVTGSLTVADHPLSISIP